MRAFVLLIGLWALLGEAGCLGDRCSPGQILREGACVVPIDAALDGVRERGPAERGPAEQGAAGYGAVCSKHADCTGKTNYCIITLGAASGYCTSKGCSQSASDCPAPYTCADLGKFVPGLPTACVQL